MSNEISTSIDWTPPSSTISLEYESLSPSSSATVKGSADPNTTIIIENETNAYEGIVNEDGTFEIPGVALANGLNSYTVRIKDRAGNEVVSEEKVKISYEGGDLDGLGVATGPGQQLPESAGELEAAMDFLTGNSMMLIIGVAALAVLGISSYAVFLTAKKQ